MNFNLGLTLSGLIYTILVSIVFFNRKKLDIYETKVYSFLLLFTFLELVLGMFGWYTILNINKIPVLNRIVNILYLISLDSWILLFTLYIVSISFSVEKKQSIDKINKIFIIIYIIVVLMITILPINFVNNGISMYTAGAAVDFTYFIAILCILLIIFSAIKNYHNLLTKKYIPMFCFLFLGTIALIIQMFYPDVFLVSPLEVLVTITMYFTIENPDMKLLEEVHKSKEISDAANEEKTMFLYNMTQEIRNTTNDINNNADMILDSVSLEEDKECAREIKGITSRFNSMTNELFDVSKIDASNIKVYNSKYNIKNILKEIVTLYNKTCKDKGLSFRVNIDHDVPEILYGDSIGLKEVLNIIMDNSVKYTKEGFIEFNVNTIIKNDICRLIMTVEDSGVGIKSEDINKMKIGNKSLSKANKLITLMNGAMVVSSNYGMGTKVKIVLDQKIELNMNEDIVKYSEIYDNIKLLMIDDSESGIKIIEKLIKGSNIKMDFAMNGKECIEKIKTYNKYDIILLDEQLSQISAMELIKKIKDIRNFDTPIILLTKDNSYEYNDEFKKLGFSDYLLKPVKKEELLNKINEYTKNK